MQKQEAFALKGDIIYSESPKKTAVFPGHFLVCEGGTAAGVFPTLPEKYAGVPVEDHSGRLIIPGLVDLHAHAPQYAYCGLSMDKELLEWLDTVTFPEEAKLADMAYAEKSYGIFTDALVNGATTRACVFATLHVPTTLLLMEKLEAAGMAAFVGKVNMNRNAPQSLCEDSAEASLAATRQWLNACGGRFSRVKPILTPRFIPSCTDDLMRGLAAMQRELCLPVQSHLSENIGEVDWVQKLCPKSGTYGGAYEALGLFGGSGCPTVMAHCVHSGPEETALMKERGVFVAHCPNSNTNLASGIAPARRYLDGGLKMGLGTDVAGGFSLSIFRAMSDAVQCSKLRWRLVDDALAPLTVPEVFYLATKGGGEFFGKVGSFEEGYEFDAVVLDDSTLKTPRDLTPFERLERIVYLSADSNVTAKYVAGTKAK